MERSQKIQRLRDMADFLDAHPKFELPHEINYGANWSVFLDDVSQLAAHIRQVGACEKFSATWGTGVKTNIAGFPMTISASRELVCERRVVGTKTELVPDPDAALVEREVEVVEWVCPDSLLAAGDGR